MSAVHNVNEIEPDEKIAEIEMEKQKKKALKKRESALSQDLFFDIMLAI